MARLRLRFSRLAAGLAAVVCAAAISHAAAEPSLPMGPAFVQPERPTPALTMTLGFTIGGDISPKSVDASGGGLVFAQNMMYRHSITVYSSDGRLLRTIPDTVNLAAFGYSKYTGEVYHGAPVEAAFSPDGASVYATNYAMYGKGFGPEGDDACANPARIDPSFVYRIDVNTLAIDQVIAVGKVPKYIKVTPDGRYVLVSNWCSYDESVIDARTAREVKRIPIGPIPRGIAVAHDSSVAYVAPMGSSDIAVIHLADFSTTWFRGIGWCPRQLMLSPDDRWLYATLNCAGRVVKIDTRSGALAASAVTGSAPRSMAISADGLSLYVVNYESGTVAKLRASDLKVLQTIRTAPNPIGVTYDALTGDVWVACYSGVIEVFHET